MRVVVGIDGSDHSRETLRAAYTAAARTASPLEVTYIWHREHLGRGAATLGDGVTAEEAEEVIGVAVADLAEHNEAGVVITPHLVQARKPAEALLAGLQEDDIVVVGASGHGPLGRIGSVAEHVIHHAPCPVLVIPRH